VQDEGILLSGPLTGGGLMHVLETKTLGPPMLSASSTATRTALQDDARISRRRGTNPLKLELLCGVGSSDTIPTMSNVNMVERFSGHLLMYLSA